MSKLDDLVKSIEKLARSPGDPMAHLAVAVDLVSYSPILGQIPGSFKLLCGPADRFRRR